MLTILFAFVQIFGWQFRTVHNLQIIVDYLPNVDMSEPDYTDYVYTIGPGDFLPNFVVFTDHVQSESGTIPTEKYYWQPSDQRYWDVFFETYEFDADGNQSTQRIDAILCSEYVTQAEGLNPADEEMLRDEFEASDHSYQLCPDTDVY